MKKKIFSIFLCLFLFLSLLSPALAAEELYTVSNENGTYLYYLASASSTKLAWLRQGSVLTVGDSSAGFVKTEWDGYEGWVSLKDLSAYGSRKLAAITVETPPDKTVYYEDDVFSGEGLSVAATYTDGSKQPVTGYAVSAPDMHSAGKKNVFVSYGGKFASFSITVNRLPIDRIEVSSLPKNTKVVEDSDEYDFTGLAVTVFYTDGRAPTQAEGYTLSGIDPHKTGRQTVNINYKYPEINASFEIEVVKKTPVNLRMTRLPDKTVYYDNNLTPDYTGLELTVDYDNGKSALVRPDRVEFKQPITTEYKNTILIYYSHFMTEYYVDVIAEKPDGIAAEVLDPIRVPLGTPAEEIDLSSVMVYLVYNSGRREAITDYTVDPVDTSTFGEKIVNVYSEDYAAFFTVSVVSDALPGDVNKDGKVNSTDARLTLRCASRLIEFTDEQRSIADVNGDGKVATADARRILRHASKIELLTADEGKNSN